MTLIFDAPFGINGVPGGGSVDESRIIVKSATIPTANEDNLGFVYQYIGATNATYTHGYIYECVKSGSSYVWERIDVQPGATRGRFLALWNCATGLAESNPPSSPYPYGAGDYYIVGTVGTTNYKPSGSSYVIGTASLTVETDEVAVNDTYYYDGTNWNLQKNTETEYTAGTGISISGKTISVTSPTLTNTATGTNSLTISGTSTSDSNSINIGNSTIGAYRSVAIGDSARSTNMNSVAVGFTARAGASSIAIGSSARAIGFKTISIGGSSVSSDEVQNTIILGSSNTPIEDSNKFFVVNGNSQYELLDLTTGKIPADRLPSTAPSIDNVTITENSSNELQASAVMNARTGTDALPIWQGTEQQWTNGKATDWYCWKTPLISNFTTGEDCVIDYNAFTALTTWYGNGALNGNISSQPSSFSNVELLIKCKIPSITPSLGSNNGLYGLTSLGFKSGTTSKYMGIYVYKNSSNYYFCTHADPDSSSIIAPSSTSPLYNFATDTWFWLKYTKTGNSFVFEYSINGIDWNTVGSKTYSFTIDTISSIYLTGNIMTSSGILYDLNECYVKIGDSVYWQPEVSQSQCYTLEATPTTASTVYSEPNTSSALTVTSVGTGTITLSDNNTYTYTSSGDVTTYQTIGDAYPNYLANINGVGVKIGNTLIADNTDTSTLQTTSNLVTSVSSSSTDMQYPSAKLFYDTCGDIETLINAL